MPAIQSDQPRRGFGGRAGDRSSSLILQPPRRCEAARRSWRTPIMLPRWVRLVLYCAVAAAFSLARAWKLAGLVAAMLLLELHNWLRRTAPSRGRVLPEEASGLCLLREAEGVTLAGAVISIVGLAVVYPIKHLQAIIGLAAGSGIGLVHALTFTKRLQNRPGGADLRWQPLWPERYSTSWWVALGVVVLLFLLSFTSFSRVPGGVIWGAYCGYAILWGSYVWLWVRRRR